MSMYFTVNTEILEFIICLLICKQKSVYKNTIDKQ